MADKQSFDSMGGESGGFMGGARNGFLRRLAWVVLSAALVLALFVFVSGWWYATAFSQAAGVDLGQLYESAKSGLREELPSERGRTNFLLLGLDENGQRQGSLLTDTIILVSVDTKGSVKMVSIPRDLWIDAFKTKINALYYYGELSNETTGEELVRSVIEQISGVKIHYSFVTTLKAVSSIIDAMSYVEVDVLNSFVDSKYPRDDVPVDIEPESLRYETVEFTKGWHKFDGKTALKFIRSRNSENEDEGTDIGRSMRQQQIVNAILARISSREILSNPAMMGGLYGLWHKEVRTNFSDKEMVSLGRMIGNNNLSFETLVIPLESELEEGLLYHPIAQKYNQWVYEPVDPSWKELQGWFNNNLD